MGARKNINVTGASKLTATASGNCTITHFAIFSASTSGTQKTNWTALDTPRTLTAGGQLSIADAAIYVTTGATGNTAGIRDSVRQSMLDGAFANGDYIAWSENGSSESANLARTAVDAWDAAITF